MTWLSCMRWTERDAAGGRCVPDLNNNHVVSDGAGGHGSCSDDRFFKV